MPYTKDEALKYLGLTPAVVPGTTPGATYTVVVRTARGFVGVRRVASQSYRVRAERFDGEKLHAAVERMRPLRVNLSSDQAHISTVVVGHSMLAMAISRFASLLIVNELQPDDFVMQAEAQAVQAEQEMIAAAKETLATLEEVQPEPVPTDNADGPPPPKDPEDPSSNLN